MHYQGLVTCARLLSNLPSKAEERPNEYHDRNGSSRTSDHSSCNAAWADFSATDRLVPLPRPDIGFHKSYLSSDHNRRMVE